MIGIWIRRQVFKSAGLAAVIAALCAAAASSSHAAPAINQLCTIASPPQRATIEVAIPNAPDFCELLSYALASEVFRSRTVVVPGALWKYASSTLSCDLRYRHTAYEIVVSNSRAACAWLTRRGSGWHATSTPLPR
jgi:hypothetical protein